MRASARLPNTSIKGLLVLHNPTLLAKSSARVLRAAVLPVCFLGLFAPAFGQNRVVFSFGASGEGRDGQGVDTGFTPIATRIDNTNFGGLPFAFVDAGMATSTIAAKNGAPYTFGRNEFGLSGLGHTGGNTLVATQMLPGALGTRAVVAAAGDLHQTLLLTDDGLVFACGSNQHASTGQGTRVGNVLAPTQIVWTNLQNRYITQVVAGGLHSLVLADNGRVYSFGSNWEGQTGLGASNTWTLSATAINTTNIGARSIVRMAAAWNHSLVVADDGVVFSFGWNANGKTGRNTTSGITGIATPIVTTNLGGRPIVDVAAGSAFSLVLADDGAVFSFGANVDGATGLGTTVGDTLVATPVNLAALGARKVVQIAAGAAHSLLLADDGTVFAFGSNGASATGRGVVDGVTTTPMPIDVTNLAGYRVVQISGGAWYSLLLAEPLPVDPPWDHYCTAGVSTHGCSPSLSATGWATAGNVAGFVIDATGVEGSRQGLMFYGINGRMGMPWGLGSSSFMCVKAPTQRMGVQNTGGTNQQCDGAMSVDWLAFIASRPSALGAPFSPGVTVNVQGWYRDPPAPKTTNLTNALEFVTQH